MTSGSGHAGVVAAAVKGVAEGIAAADAAAAGEQIPMFEPPTRFADDDGAIERARRQRGRPPGAANRSTKEFREWLLRRGEHPLQWMMRWASHTPESLARELGCTMLEAFDRLKALHQELAPYFAAKMVAVDDQGRPVPMMVMQFGQFGAPPSEGGKAPWLYLENEQNQPLGDAAANVSHGQVSHAGEKPA